jgi:hypothetical protein
VSGSSIVAYLDPTPGHDNRNQPFTLSILQHSIQRPLVCSHVEVFERYPLLFAILTGLRSVGSSVLAENQYFLLHITSIIWITWTA